MGKKNNTVTTYDYKKDIIKYTKEFIDYLFDGVNADKFSIMHPTNVVYKTFNVISRGRYEIRIKREDGTVSSYTYSAGYFFVAQLFVHAFALSIASFDGLDFVNVEPNKSIGLAKTIFKLAGGTSPDDVIISAVMKYLDHKITEVNKLDSEDTKKLGIEILQRIDFPVPIMELYGYALFGCDKYLINCSYFIPEQGGN